MKTSARLLAVERPERGERAKSAGRAMAIIEHLVEADRGFTFTELEQTLGLPKSSLHELLSVMLAHRFIELDADSREYRLGIRVWESGQAYLRHHDLVAEARPVMARIVSAVDETAQLAVLDEMEIVYLEKVDCVQPIRLQSFVGKRLPAHQTALGKVLLAALEDDELAALLSVSELRGSTANTITGVAELTEEARRVRARGFGIDNEEFARGLRCIAVPILDHGGATIASIGISAPRTRASAARLGQILTFLAGGAVDISERLGCPPQALAATVALTERSPAEVLVREALDRTVPLLNGSLQPGGAGANPGGVEG